jgi:hypothetical protein
MTPFGLGDIAYYVLRPFVLSYDWLYGTDLRDCIKCKKRRKAWNAAFSVPAWLAITFFVTICASVICYLVE